MDINIILETLLKLGKEILFQKNVEKLIETIANITREVLNADRCSIFLYDKEKDILYSKIAHGVKRLEIPKDKGIVGFTFNTGEIQIVLDAYKDSRFYPEIDKVTGYKTKSLLTAPLLDSKNKPFGVIEVINKKEGFFTNFDAELLVLFSSYISYILENAFLNEKVGESYRKLIYKLSSAAEFKDEETSLHTKRVALYSSLIAENIPLEEEFSKNIRFAAPMHDVGKIGIPDKILLKKGKLTKEEFDIIKTHPTIGYKILFDPDSELLKIAANIARDHHEKWNGTGYPMGKKEEEISIEGRIVAIADVFDALVSKRPYKQPFSFDKAMEIIKEGKGKHFDPILTEIFLNNKKLVYEIYLNYKEDL